MISLYSSVVEQFPCKEEVPGSNPGSPIHNHFYTLILEFYMEYFKKLVAKSISDSAPFNSDKILELLEYPDKTTGVISPYLVLPYQRN